MKHGKPFFKRMGKGRGSNGGHRRGQGKEEGMGMVKMKIIGIYKKISTNN